MKSRILAASLVLGLGFLFAAAFAQGPGSAGKSTAGDEEAIRKAMAAYTTAFNKGDLDGLMALWSADGEFVTEEGKVIRGKEALTSLFKKGFADNKGTTIKINSKSIRFLRPDVAVQDAIVFQTSADKTVDNGPYTSIWFKTDGKWLLGSVRDLPGDAAANGPSNYDNLKQLEWLIGDWTSEGKNTVVDMTCKWDKNQNFLMMEQTINLKNDNPLSITQIIGWDPLQQQIRSWLFDSRGGFGEALWTRRGNQWDLAASGVLSDARPTSSLNSWKFIDDNACEWEATERQIDSKPVPDVKVKFVKKTAKN
jgi:uncharacterized protein (TIGR02246 family)